MKKRINAIVLCVLLTALLTLGACKAPVIGTRQSGGTLTDFALAAPENSAAGSELLPVFQWTDANAERYSITVSKNQDLTFPVINVSNIADVKYAADKKLEYNTVYYWTVTAHAQESEKNCGEVRSFKTLDEKINLEAVTIEDFDSYDLSKQSDLLNLKFKGDGDGAVTQFLSDGALDSGNYMKLMFSIINSGGKAFSRLTADIQFGLKYSSGISLKLKPVSKAVGKIMTISMLESGGEIFRNSVIIEETASGAGYNTIRLPFTGFERKSDEGAPKNNIFDFGNFKWLTLSFSGSDVQNAIILIDSISTYIDESKDYSNIPQASALSLPAADRDGTDLNPVFLWEAAADAFCYDLQISADETFENIALTVRNILLNIYSPIPALETDTNYFWRIIAKNTAGTVCSEARTFKTRKADEYTIDDFEDYTTAQAAIIYKQRGGGAISVSIENGGMEESKCLKIDTNLGVSPNWSRVQKSAAMNVLGFDGVSLFIKRLPDQTPNPKTLKMTVAFEELSGEIYMNIFTVTQKVDFYEVKIPFADFVKHTDSPNQNNKFDLSSISSFMISFSGEEQITIYVDSVSAYITPADIQ